MEEKIGKPILIKEPLYPNNGRHSLLVINKEHYQEMILRSKRKKSKIKLIEDMKCLSQHKLFRNSEVKRNLSLDKIHISEKDEKSVKKKDSFFNKMKLSCKVYFEDKPKLAGDTADDVIPEDE